jgi:hypothetical protein
VRPVGATVIYTAVDTAFLSTHAAFDRPLIPTGHALVA